MSASRIMPINIEQQGDELPSGPPPPYIEAAFDNDDGSDVDDASAPDMRLSINAEQTVRGSHNLVPINDSQLTHAARVSAMLVSAINHANELSTHDGLLSRKLNIRLNINCGINVIGDRNIIGNFGVNQKISNASVASTSSAATAGAKRKADDGDQGPVKRVAQNGTS